VRNYHPGFFGALFLVLLRIAIGWHFLNEGLEKYNSTRRGGKPFTAEPYLRAANGPLGTYFRNLVPDVNGLETLDPARLKAAWTADVDRIMGHFNFAKEQRDKGYEELRKAEEYADIWFSDKEMKEKKEKYFHDLRGVMAVESNREALSYQRERAADQRRKLDTERKELLADLVARGNDLRAKVVGLATKEQLASDGPYVPPPSSLDTINALTTFGLLAMGVCLIAGLFGSLPPLAAAVFLGQIYLSTPPWPGLPQSPMTEGHYWIVNKNLIEMLACLVLVFIPTSSWVGLDPLIFGWMFRRRVREEIRPAADSRTGTGKTAPVADKPIPPSRSGFSEKRK
jgi:uncharacterized membrane protein YphA (DoxX/SURF4 family)